MIIRVPHKETEKRDLWLEIEDNQVKVIDPIEDGKYEASTVLRANRYIDIIHPIMFHIEYKDNWGDDPQWERYGDGAYNPSVDRNDYASMFKFMLERVKAHQDVIYRIVEE